MTLPKNSKIKSRYIFRNLKKFEYIDSNNFYKLIGSKQELLNNPRNNISPQIGLIISKRVYKSAVKRNKCKRRLSEAYKIAREKYMNKLAKYKYLVFILRQDIYDCAFNNLINSCELSLSKLSSSAD